MKKMLFPALAALLLTVGACTQKSEYTNALPPDVESIVSLSPMNLADKAGLGGQENEVVLQKLKDALKKELPADNYQTVEKLLNNPAEAGLDLQSPWYLFTSPSLSKGALVTRVADEGNLQALLDKLAEENQIETEVYENYTLVQPNGALLAYNGSTLFVASTSNGQQATALKDSLNNWMQQDAARSFSVTPIFQKMEEQTGDIKAICSYASFDSYLKMANAVLPQGIDYKNIRFITALSFEKGSVDLNMIPYTEDEQAKALMAKQAKALRAVKNTFIDYFPQSTLCLLNIGMDGAAYYDILMGSTAFGEQLSAKEAESIKKLFGMFQEDFTLGLVNVTLDKLPSVLAYATVKDAAPLKELANNPELLKKLSRGSKIMELEADQYVLRDRLFNLFFGVRDGKFYATNDETLYKNILKKCDPSAAKTEYASAMKGKKACFVLNVQAVSQLPIVKMLAGFGGPKYASLFTAVENISYLKSESDGEKTFVSLQLKNRDDNALKQIADLGKAAIQ